MDVSQRGFWSIAEICLHFVLCAGGLRRGLGILTAPDGPKTCAGHQGWPMGEGAQESASGRSLGLLHVV